MILLDTDHISEFERGASSVAKRLRDRLRQSTEQKAVSIVSVEELMRGWLTRIHQERNPVRQIVTYERLQSLVNSLSKWIILSWDMNAATTLLSLKNAKPRLGTMDLKIASIAIANDALLLSRNLRDFQQVPGLRVENWLD